MKADRARSAQAGSAGAAHEQVLDELVERRRFSRGYWSSGTQIQLRAGRPDQRGFNACAP